MQKLIGMAKVILTSEIKTKHVTQSKTMCLISMTVNWAHMFIDNLFVTVTDPCLFYFLQLRKNLLYPTSTRDW